jgi:hypothetical protein
LTTSVAEVEVDLRAVHQQLVDIEKEIVKVEGTHNAFLRELALCRPWCSITRPTDRESVPGTSWASGTYR